MSEYISPKPEKSIYSDKLLDIIEQYLNFSDAEFMLDLEGEDQVTYVYGRLAESNVDPDMIFHEFDIVSLAEFDEWDLVMSDTDARAETLGEILENPNAFSKVIDIINEEYSSEV